jgi:hypothetical protein
MINEELLPWRELLREMVELAVRDAKRETKDKDAGMQFEADMHQASAISFLKSRFFKEYCTLFNLPSQSIRIQALK